MSLEGLQKIMEAADKVYTEKRARPLAGNFYLHEADGIPSVCALTAACIEYGEDVNAMRHFDAGGLSCSPEVLAAVHRLFDVTHLERTGFICGFDGYTVNTDNSSDYAVAVNIGNEFRKKWIKPC